MTILLPSLKIKPPQWMCDPSLIKIMDTLNHDNINARIVGGCIRNQFFNKDIYDIDIACIYTPEKTIEVCNSAGIKTIPTGIKHGTVTAHIQGRNFEITTLREDIETDGRHAKVAFTDNWINDAKRRDFTINALYADRDGSIYDPLGSGLIDLQNNVVRFIGNPTKRIEEDYLRILRFFRFFAEYHRGEPNRDSLSACFKFKDGLENISHERICNELFKLLKSNQAYRAIDLMKNISSLKISNDAAIQLKTLTDLQNQLQKTTIWSRYYTAINEKKFITNNKIKFFFNSLNKFIENWDGNITLSLYRFDRDIVIQGLLILKAQGNDISDTMVTEAINHKVPLLPIIAKDIMDRLKINEGPIVGLKMREAENLWIKSGFLLNRDDILNSLKA